MGPEHGKELKKFLLLVMRKGGNVNYARNPENRMALLKAIFDFNNCQAAMGCVDFLGDSEISSAVAEQTAHVGTNEGG